MAQISRKSTLVGIVCLLVLCVTISSYSQAKTANNVQGTSWESPKQPLPLGSGMGHLYYLYNFEPNGVMTLEAIAIQNVGLTDGGEIIQPTSGSSPKTRGKYRLDGKSITIELTDLVINATVYENSIIGESVDKVDSTRKVQFGNGNVFVGGNGETKQVVTKVNLFSKQQLLLAVESSSGRSGKYEIKIGGALGASDTGKSTRSAGEVAQIAIANSYGEIVPGPRLSLGKT